MLSILLYSCILGKTRSDESTLHLFCIYVLPLSVSRRKHTAKLTGQSPSKLVIINLECFYVAQQSYIS